MQSALTVYGLRLFGDLESEKARNLVSGYKRSFTGWDTVSQLSRLQL